MAAIVLDGREMAKGIRIRLKKECAALKAERGITPGLAVILMGDDPASQVYVRNKQTACARAGMRSELYALAGDVSQGEVLALINRLNADAGIHGILIQAPRPPQIDDETIDNAVDPLKDVDGFNQVNAGRFYAGRQAMEACTPAGVIYMLKQAGIKIAGRQAVVLGRSNIVGKPMALMLLRENATVTLCHSRSENLAGITRQADILVSAIGKPGFVTADMVKPGAVVVDVGINATPQGLRGDVDYQAVAQIAGAITPVPGGVGPMTIAMLLENTMKAAKRG